MKLKYIIVVDNFNSSTQLNPHKYFEDINFE